MNIVTIIEYGVAFIVLYITVFLMLLTILNFDKIKKNKTMKKDWAPYLSVIIPAYNEEHTIRKCINSVLDSDYPSDKIEIIVVDDGSTDQTYEVANSINDKRIKVYKRMKSGKATSLNFGLAKAHGEFVATLDADSYICKSAIKKMLAYFSDNEVGAVTSAIKIEKKKEGILNTIQKIEYLFVIFSRNVLSHIDAVPVTPGPLSIFKTKVLRNVDGFDEKSILEDQEIALRLQSKNYKIKASLDADVYTEVPQTFSDLVKQRVRWNRGGLRNTIKYIRLISPAYGDFGLIILPLISLVTLIVLFMVAILVIITYFSPAWYYLSRLGLEGLPLLIGSIHTISLSIFLLNFAWVLWGLTVFHNEKIKGWEILIYLFVYSYLYTIYWIATIVKEILREKVTW